MSDSHVLLLMRHARPDPPGALPDAARALSTQGRAQAQGVGERLRELPPQLVMSSPALRCRQTAEGVVRGLGLAAPPAILVHEALGHDDAVEAIADIQSRTGRLLVVSHQPTILGLGTHLLGGAAAPLDLRPAQVAILSGGPGAWRLERILEPPG